MEAWLDSPEWVPEAQFLAEWKAGFDAALTQAEKAPGWPDMMIRAHAAGERLLERSLVLEKELNRLRLEIQAQERGNRALKGYGATVR
ncbi:hypothetical protein [Geothrix sp. PMB-07]|uniref:hypothetical protein n=1 Tax=Geothrix sp. PMB-07 TaxID=3068640 RepID=UPI0027410364|nr:hypothetical protein [Geothrix sp. PMB-07]WLT31808.1 hypothetical protein Q9293_00460 [Geothrix sp. PMB-07]